MAARAKKGDTGKISAVRGSESLFNDAKFLRFKELFFELKQEYGKNFDKFFSLEEEYLIPCSIFSKRLSSLESIVKYLVENCGLRVSSTAKLFKRTDKTVWQAYKSGAKKHPQKFINISSKFWIPASLFADRKISVLEHISVYLKSNYNLSLKQISKIIFRDITTIRTVYYRAMRKQKLSGAQKKPLKKRQKGMPKIIIKKGGLNEKI